MSTEALLVGRYCALRKMHERAVPGVSRSRKSFDEKQVSSKISGMSDWR